jgi:hypothetical protein
VLLYPALGLRPILFIIRSDWLLRPPPTRALPSHLRVPTSLASSLFFFLGWRLRQLAALRQLNKPRADRKAVLSMLACNSFGVTSAQSVLLLVLSADYPWTQSWESLVVCLLWDLTCNSGCFNLFTSLGFTQPLTHRQCKLVTTLEGSHLLFKMLSLVPFDIN